MIKRLMEKDPQKRITAKEALAHRWIQQKVKTKFDKQVAMNAINELQNFRVSSASLYCIPHFNRPTLNSAKHPSPSW